MANGRGTVYMRAGQWTIGFTVNGGAASISKHEIGSGMARIVGQQIKNCGIHRNVARLAVLAVPNENQTRREVDIPKAKIQDFAQAHSGVQSNGNNRTDTGRDAGLEQAVAFLD